MKWILLLFVMNTTDQQPQSMIMYKAFSIEATCQQVAEKTIIDLNSKGLYVSATCISSNELLKNSS